jgi:G3E family GTPase
MTTDLLRPTATVATGLRRVTVLSGFLGSGKTTLLRASLMHAGNSGTAPAVVVNDLAGQVTDGALHADGLRRAIVLSGGCVCCTRRADLASALMRLLDAEQRGLTPPRDHVVVETSGLSDPGPIAFTLANDPVLCHHYTLDRICVTVDALTGLDSVERHGVALRQLRAADQIFITKADLARLPAIQALVTRLHKLNPSAGITVTANGEPLRVEVARTRRAATAVAGGPAAQPGGGSPTGDGHTGSVSTLELVTGEPLDWQAFAAWLSLLLHAHGPDILRVKGVLEVHGAGHVAINAVQHIVHQPQHLAGSVPPGTRLVVITQNVDVTLLERSFHTFLAISDR